MKKVVMIAVALAIASTAYAQTPMPLSRAVVSDEVAGRTLMKMQINATVARPPAAARHAVAAVSLPATGDIVDACGMAAVRPIGVETGLMKAQTALYARTPSSEVAQR